MSRPSAAPTRGAPVIDVMIESPLWKAHRGLKTLLRRAVAEAAALLPRTQGELAIVLTDDSAIRALNRTWRGKDEPTNVLSFPASRRSKQEIHLLGDIVIAHETAAREAAAKGKRLQDHLAHLAVHGFLHLLGYDHETNREAAAMERLEIAALRRLDIPNPYVARGAKG